MEYVKAVAFEGEGYIWTAVIGGDGRSMADSYPGGKLAALDLKTLEIEDMELPLLRTRISGMSTPCRMAGCCVGLG